VSECPITVDGLAIVRGTPRLAAVAWTTASLSTFEAS
jgi:hypothetical protein